MGYLRLYLAIAVVFTHTSGALAPYFPHGSVAVAAFFMVSGFLMQLVLSNRYVGRGRLWLFYSNRMLRLYPGYAAAMGVAVIAYTAAGVIHDRIAQMAEMNAGQLAWFLFTQITILGQDTFAFMRRGVEGWEWSTGRPEFGGWRLLFLPPSWTVSLELMFYALAPWLAGLRSRWLLAIIAVSFAARLYVYSLGFQHDPWSYRFFPFEIATFVAGMLAFRLRGHRVLQGPWFAIAFAISLPLITTGQSILAGAGMSQQYLTLAFLLLLMATLPRLFQLDRQLWHSDLIGQLSYPVYLLHWPIMVYIHKIMPGDSEAIKTQQSLIILFATLVLALGVTLLIEQPLTRLRQSRTTARLRGEKQKGSGETA